MVLVRKQKSAFPVVHNLGHPIDAGGDDRFRSRHGFENDQWQSFAVGAQNEDVERIQEARDVMSVAGENERLGNAAGPHVSLHLAIVLAILL